MEQEAQNHETHTKFILPKDLFLHNRINQESTSIGGIRMNTTNKLNFADVKKKIGEHLKTALNVQEFSITFAKQEENIWKVRVEFKEMVGSMEWPTIAFFSIDATTGEVIEFQKGPYGHF